MDNLEVKFYDTVNDELLKFAVIVSQSNGKWVFCKHKERDTYEVPGGHEELGMLTELDMKKRFLSLDEKEQRERLNREQENELQYAPEPMQNTIMEKKSEATQEKRKLVGEDTIMNRMAQWQYTKEQKEELHKMMALGMTKVEILAVFYPETDVAKMREIRRTYRTVKTYN